MKLYEYQERVRQHILAGESVVLQAPTGSGKTRAALTPFFDAFFNLPAGSFPARCFYVVPMRVLANQFWKEYQESNDTLPRNHRRDLRVTIQTGDQPQDPRFDQGDLIFCTIDQFLSSYLTIPYSLSKRMANLNAGAIVGAYIVLDEFHLLDPVSTLPTTLYILKQLSKLAPVLLMTATFSRTMLDTLAGLIGARVELISAEEARDIEQRKPAPLPRRRAWQTINQPITAEAVLAGHRTRSLALCNTVRGTMALYDELEWEIKKQGLDIRLMMLHSRFLPEDRRKIEADLKRLFGIGQEADNSGSIIAVATQAIEVGVDVTSERLHTQLAPASALIQRAGRCARYPGEQGEVIVYPVESYLPYGVEKEGQDDPWVIEMKAADRWLQEHEKQALDFIGEQELINAVASPLDKQTIQELSFGRARREQEIHRIFLGEKQEGDTNLLIRDADSCRVLISDTPDQLLSDPFAAVGFNLSRIVLRGMVSEWMKRDIDVDWRVKYLASDKNTDNERGIDFGWKPLPNADCPIPSSLVVVNPELAGYSAQRGFLPLGGGEGFRSNIPPLTSVEIQTGEGYKLESYEEHIQRVLEGFAEAALPWLFYPASALERIAKLPTGSIVRAAWLAALFHDVGKLNIAWQDWAHAYQELIGIPAASDYAIAHTDFKSSNPTHKEANDIASRKFPKPPHAAEGAMAVFPVLSGVLPAPLNKAAAMAISRHHSPFAQEFRTFHLHKDSLKHIQKTLAYLSAGVADGVVLSQIRRAIRPEEQRGMQSLLVMPSQVWGWLAYLLLARALRIADQEGTKKLSATLGSK
jgi:CRISPR-associated endonuclease/helicase Cas3